MLSLLIAFVHLTNLRVFHHCFFRCFYFTTDFSIVFRVFSFHQLSLPLLFFVRYVIFVLLYHECYGFERAFFRFQAFFTLLSFPISDTTCIYQGFLGAGSFALKVVGPPTDVKNTDPAHLFG